MGDGQRILYPGNAERSQLYHRVNSTTPGIMMPPLAKGRVDERGVALLKEWIDGMNTPPTAVASSDRTTGNAPLTVTFTGSASTDDRGMASYAWEFGDGATATAADPSHLYTAPGKYTATLTVTDLDGLTSTTSIDILVTGGEVDNTPDANVNLALLPDAVISGTVTGGRGTPQTILYDPSKNNYFITTPYNEYGVLYNQNLGRPGADDGFEWRTDWLSRKRINYITFGGTYPNQPQPNTMWRISYRQGDLWTVLEQGQGGWIDKGIFEWGGPEQAFIEADALRVQLYSDGNSDLVSIHLRGRGGRSTIENDTANETKATLIQYLPLINQAPQAAATADIYSGEAPLMVNFTGSASIDDTGITSYKWEFGDGNTSNEADPSHEFQEPGVYTVILTVSDAKGLESTDQLIITVNAPNAAPQAVATADIYSGEAPLMVNFTGSTSTDDTGITSYNWEFGDGETSNQADPSHEFQGPGVYTVTLTVSDAEGLESTHQLDITVNEPNAAPQAVATADIYSGETPLLVNFTGSTSSDDTGITSYNWEFGDGNTSNEVDPSHEFQGPGVYTVTLTVSDADGLESTHQLIITVNAPNAAPQAVATADIYSGEAPIMVNLTGSASIDDTGITAYNWEFGDGNISNEVDPSHEFQEPGVYTVTLTVSDADGLESTDQLDITVNAPNAAPQAVATADVYSGESPLMVNFTGSVSTDDTGITSYNWEFGDGNTSNEADPSHEFQEPGMYKVTLTVSDAEGLESTNQLDITVNQPNAAPQAAATADIYSGEAPLMVNFTGSASIDDTGITSYDWEFGDGNTSNEANPSHEFQEPGLYMVTLAVSDTEGLESQITIEIDVLEKNEALAQFEFEVIMSPNPTKDYIEITMKALASLEDFTTILIHDSSGRLIKSYDPRNVFNNGIYRIPLFTLMNESYFVTVLVEGNKPISKRIIITR